MITNSTSTDVTFRGAGCTRVVAKQEDSHYTATVDTQTNEEKSQNPLQTTYWIFISSKIKEKTRSEYAHCQCV